jgi:hypothetical protein
MLGSQQDTCLLTPMFQLFSRVAIEVKEDARDSGPAGESGGEMSGSLVDATHGGADSSSMQVRVATCA